MAIIIQPKQDMSYLFSSLSSSASNAAGSDFLMQYASIKNGSYAKLLKAYYSETGGTSASNSSSATSTGSLSSTDAKALTEVQSATDALKESADALLVTGKNSLFEMKDIKTKDENGVETTTKGYDTEAIYKAVNDFVTDYNSVVDAVNNVENDSLINQTARMLNNSMVNVNLLNKIGITINEDSTLSIDKETFESANMNTVKSLFNDTWSYGYSVSGQASRVNYAAERAATKTSIYTGNGTYNSTYNTGNIFNTYF